MRVLIVSCVFPPEPVVSAQTSAQIAEELVRRGDAVTVICSFPSRPAGRPYPGYSRKSFRREKTDSGVELVRCFSLVSSESRLVSRFLENISFGLTGGWEVLRFKRPAVIYVNTWPVFAAGILSLIARLRKIPLVISIQDVYPESIVSQRRLSANGLLVRALQWIDGWIARQSQAIIVISESFAKIYRDSRGIESKKLHVVPNWVDHRTIFQNANPAVGFREAQSIPRDAFVVTYGGNIGMAAGTETLVEAFHSLQDLTNVYLVIAGEGSNLAACQSRAGELGLSRIIFYTPWLQGETAWVLDAADLLVLPTRGQQSAASVPSKLVTYMLAGRPVIAQTLPDVELAGLVEQSGCGWIVEPDRPDLLADQIRDVRAMALDERVKRGQAGKLFASKYFAPEVCLPRVIQVLEQAASQGEL